jgi:hypothetical protein
MMNGTRVWLEHHRSVLLDRIRIAVGRSESRAVIDASQQLKEIEDLLQDYAALDTRAQRLLATAETVIGSQTEPPSTVPGRAHGIEIRADFLRRASSRGQQLYPIRGSIFGLGDIRVGIAVATERQPNKWFLGLPQNGFDAAVLLCRNTAQEVMDICLPRSFVSQYASRLSASRGQLKFNIVRRVAGYHLLVPGIGAVDVQRYIDALTTLAS